MVVWVRGDVGTRLVQQAGGHGGNPVPVLSAARSPTDLEEGGSRSRAEPTDHLPDADSIHPQPHDSVNDEPPLDRGGPGGRGCDGHPSYRHCGGPDMSADDACGGSEWFVVVSDYVGCARGGTIPLTGVGFTWGIDHRGRSVVSLPTSDERLVAAAEVRGRGRFVPIWVRQLTPEEVADARKVLRADRRLPACVRAVRSSARVGRMWSGDRRRVRPGRHRLLTEASTVDVLDWGAICEQVRIIRDVPSVNDRLVVNALVEVSSWLYSAQHAGSGTASPGDVRVMDRLLAAVRTISSGLAERFRLPAVHMAATTPAHGREPTTAVATHLWKPLGRLWTAPVAEPASAWALWATETGNARPWDRQIRYDTPAAASRVVVDSLESADELVGQHTFMEVAHSLEAAGVERVDFSWRCVLEAECSALRGERDAIGYPCALGTESSLWLTTPEPASQREYHR